MKSKYLLTSVLFVLSSFLCLAQIPNSGFEQWAGGEPDGWFTYNQVVPGTPAITQSSTAHSGSSAARGDVVSFQTIPFPPQMYSSGIFGQNGFPITQRYTSISGFSIFNSVSGDEMVIAILVWKAGEYVGYGGGVVAPSSSYTEFVLPIGYNDPNGTDIPDSAQIVIGILGIDSSESSIHTGSYFIVDDLSLGNTPTDVKDVSQPLTYKLDQNYPNPFNPSTTINYQVANDGLVTLKVYDILGNEVKTLVNEYKTKGSYSQILNATDLASGVYIYKLTANNFTATRKLTLLK